MSQTTDNWSIAFAFAVTTVVTTTFLTLIVVSMSMGATGEPVTLYLVTSFGFFVGLTGAFLAFYTQFGPRLSLPLMPRGDVPARVPALLFGLGVAVCLTSIRWLTDGDVPTLFFRVIGYSLFFAVFVGYAVSYVVRCAPDDGEGVLTASMTDVVNGNGLSDSNTDDDADR